MSKKEPQSFAFYESFYETIAALPTQKMQNELFHAVCQYGLYGKTPKNLNKTVSAMLIGFSYQIDSAKAKRERQKTSGAKGGKAKARKAKKAAPLETPQGSPGKPDEPTPPYKSSKPNENKNDKEKVNMNDKSFLAPDGKPDASADLDHQKQKRAYGEFHNVYLTDLDHNNLTYQFHDDYARRIEKLSAYKKSHPAFRSPDDYATIKLWAMRAEEEQADRRAVSPAPDADEIADTKAREQMLDDDYEAAMAAIWAAVDADASEAQNKQANTPDSQEHESFQEKLDNGAHDAEKA